MRTIVLSALLALGIGLAGAPGASAAPAASDLGNAANMGTLLQDVGYYYRRPYRYRYGSYRRCRSVRVCHRGYYGGRRCHWERICRY